MDIDTFTQDEYFMKNARVSRRKKTFFLEKIKRENIHFSFRREKLLRTSIIIEINALPHAK